MADLAARMSELHATDAEVGRLIDRDPALIAEWREGKADVWDSGSVTSADPWVVYGGPALKSATRYFWSVRVWAGSDLVSDWAEPAWFETGLLNPGDWHGQWIAGPERRGPLTDAEGAADHAEIRAAGEFCRPV